MRVVLVVAAAVVPRLASASPPHAIEAVAGGRVSLISHDEIVGRVAVTGSMRWNDRWHAGLRFSVDANQHTQIYEPSGEVGIWLHASKTIDVLLGWRLGYANFRFDDVVVHAFAAEHIADIVVRMGARTELHVAPFTVQTYYSGLWQLTVGTEVGLAWRL